MTNENTLTTKDAAKFLGISESSLRQGRMQGTRVNRIPVPPYIRVGRKIIYLKEDLRLWLEQHRVGFQIGAEVSSKVGL